MLLIVWLFMCCKGLVAGTAMRLVPEDMTELDGWRLFALGFVVIVGLQMMQALSHLHVLAVHSA